MDGRLIPPDGARPGDVRKSESLAAGARSGQVARAISGTTDSHHRRDFPVAGHLELAMQGIPVKGSELVRMEAQRVGLDGQVSNRLPKVVVGELGASSMRSTCPLLTTCAGSNRRGLNRSTTKEWSAERSSSITGCSTLPPVTLFQDDEDRPPFGPPDAHRMPTGCPPDAHRSAHPRPLWSLVGL